MVNDFLTSRPQNVRLGNHTSSTLTLNMGIPQGCVLSPALFMLFTHDCVPIHSFHTIVKLADDSTVVGKITGDNASHYGKEAQTWHTLVLRQQSCLEHHQNKRDNCGLQESQEDDTSPHIHISGEEVEQINNTKFLVLHITMDRIWAINTSLHKLNRDFSY